MADNSGVYKHFSMETTASPMVKKQSKASKLLAPETCHSARATKYPIVTFLMKWCIRIRRADFESVEGLGRIPSSLPVRVAKSLGSIHSSNNRMCQGQCRVFMGSGLKIRMESIAVRMADINRRRQLFLCDQRIFQWILIMNDKRRHRPSENQSPSHDLTIRGGTLLYLPGTARRH
jgi:hypothetical protein